VRTRFDATRVKAGTFGYLIARNSSALPFRSVVRQLPSWLRPEPGMIQPEGESLLRARITADAPAGAASVEIEIEVTNMHAAPGRNLVVRTPVQIHVDR